MEKIRIKGLVPFPDQNKGQHDDIVNGKGDLHKIKLVGQDCPMGLVKGVAAQADKKNEIRKPMAILTKKILHDRYDIPTLKNSEFESRNSKQRSKSEFQNNGHGHRHGHFVFEFIDPRFLSKTLWTQAGIILPSG